MNSVMHLPEGQNHVVKFIRHLLNVRSCITEYASVLQFL